MACSSGRSCEGPGRAREAARGYLQAAILHQAGLLGPSKDLSDNAWMDCADRARNVPDSKHCTRRHEFIMTRRYQTILFQRALFGCPRRSEWREYLDIDTHAIPLIPLRTRPMKASTEYALLVLIFIVRSSPPNRRVIPRLGILIVAHPARQRRR